MAQKRGEAGIGTLILFIAMILVAAISASVLLQTSGSLQSKSLSAGSKSQEEISNQVSVIRLWAENGSLNSLGYMYIDLHLGPGSDPLSFSNLLVDFQLSDASAASTYQATYVQCDQVTIDGLVFFFPNKYGVQYITPASNHMDGYLQQGEIARICLAPPRNLTEKESYRLNILPKRGSIAQIKGSTPDTFIDSRVDLFP